MSKIADAFYGDIPAPYPQGPGWKERGGGTSRLAAKAMGTSASNLRADVLREITAEPDGLTADEVAGRLKVDRLAIRPRVTELGKMTPPRIVKSGRTRKNESGQSAAVWIVATGENR